MAAAAAIAGEEPLHRGIPDEIAIWEILVRLPPKALLCCRTVCHAWRRATSSRSFLLAHHAHQPALPILCHRCFDDTLAVCQTLDIVALDHNQLRPVARLGSHDLDNGMRLEASCDGLLLLSTESGDEGFYGPLYFSVCNPATRQYAPLPLLRGFRLGGMYPHPPTGEYRLLVYPALWESSDEESDDERCPGTQDAWHVYTVGSCHPPRHIGRPEAAELIIGLLPVLFRGNLHWYLQQEQGGGELSMIIMVFDTTAELFRWMRAPALPGTADLLEMDQVLGMASFDDTATTIDIWMTQDYDSEVWAFKYRVELPVAELTERFLRNKYRVELPVAELLERFLRNKSSNTVVLSRDDNDVLMLLKSGDTILQIDTGGKLVARFHKDLDTTQFRLKQTLVQHTFFPAIEGYVVNSWPLISPDD